MSNTVKPARDQATSTRIDLPAVQMHLVRPTEPVVARVVRNQICTRSKKSAGFVRHIELDVSGTPLEGNFRVGQSFGVLPPGTDERGRLEKVRLYSIASPSGGEDGEGKILATTVKRTVDEHWETNKLFLGVASNYLCNLQEGDEVRVSGPNGKRFLLPARPEEHDYVFFATGTGIAPFRGMVMELLEKKVECRIALVMGAPYRTDLLYDDLFTRLEHDFENFTYIQAISREPEQPHGRGVYVQQRIATHRDEIVPLLSTDRGLIYVCGVAGMELGIFQELARQLAPASREPYLACDAETLANVDTWDRRMIHRDIKPSRRVFLEVY